MINYRWVAVAIIFSVLASFAIHGWEEPLWFDAVRLIVFFAGGTIVSQWLLERPPDELVPTEDMKLLRPNEYPPLEFNPTSPPAGFVRNNEMPHALSKLVALWAWLFVLNAAGCTVGAENARRDLATMPTSMALHQLRQERNELRDRYGDAWFNAQMQHWGSDD